MWKSPFKTEGFKSFDTLAVAWVTHPQLTANIRTHSTAEAARLCREGLRIAAIDGLAQQLDLSAKTLERVVNIAPATLRRRRKTGRLKTGESERVPWLERLLQRALPVFGGREDARGWLKTPCHALGNACPLDYADTEPGAPRSRGRAGAHRARDLYVKHRAWRILQRQHAATAFDGEGARLYGGRWNHPGTPLVYTAGTRPLALLKNYVCIPAEFSDTLLKKKPLAHLPKDWRESPPPPPIPPKTSAPNGPKPRPSPSPPPSSPANPTTSSTPTTPTTRK